MKQQLKCNINESKRKKQGKRLLAVYETSKIELKNEILLLFETFKETMNHVNNTMSKFPTTTRSRNLEASVVQSHFAEVLLKNFQEKAFIGRYRRLILKTKGYLILFKKLNKYGYPMNIKTVNTQLILNQNQSLDLFSDIDYKEEPILFFGYQKNKFGAFVNPQIVYIDEGEIKFSIGEADMQYSLSIPDYEVGKEDTKVEVKPKLKNNNDDLEKVI